MRFRIGLAKQKIHNKILNVLQYETERIMVRGRVKYYLPTPRNTDHCYEDVANIQYKEIRDPSEADTCVYVTGIKKKKDNTDCRRSSYLNK